MFLPFIFLYWQKSLINPAFLKNIVNRNINIAFWNCASRQIVSSLVPKYASMPVCTYNNFVPYIQSLSSVVVDATLCSGSLLQGFSRPSNTLNDEFDNSGGPMVRTVGTGWGDPWFNSRFDQFGKRIAFQIGAGLEYLVIWDRLIGVVA